MSKKILILQSNYIPWKGYFDLIRNVDEFVVYDDVQFTKNDWRNRNKIKTPQGVKWLTIPVFHSLQSRINDVIISDRKWKLKHWQSLRGSYGRAPFFKFYQDVFENAYLSNTSERLSEINVAFIRVIMDLLQARTKISFSTDFELPTGKTERLVEICKKLNATEYITGPAAADYLEMDLFEKESIKVTYFSYDGYLEYPQLHPPFSHEVSIVDLLFNCGPEAIRYMKHLG